MKEPLVAGLKAAESWCPMSVDRTRKSCGADDDIADDMSHTGAPVPVICLQSGLLNVSR